MCVSVNFGTVNARVLKFHMHIPHEKIVDPYFFSCLSYGPFLDYPPLNLKFENLVCKISQKVYKLEPSNLVYSLRMMSTSPDQLLRTFCQILTKLQNFEIFINFPLFGEF